MRTQPPFPVCMQWHRVHSLAVQMFWSMVLSVLGVERMEDHMKTA